jgi:cysteine desulfurase
MTIPPALREGPIYLDHNATTPVDPRVVEAALPFLTRHFGNPSSGHGYADEPRAGLARARAQVAGLIGADSPEDVLFTGSGSEANNLAVRGAVLAAGRRRPHVVTQATEHPAVLNAVHALRRLHGVDVTVLPVDSLGLVAPADLAAACTPDTALVSIMAANNETGARQPIAELAAIAHRRGALFHTDAAQLVGKLAVDVAALGVDLLTVVGHKLYAPKGIGALYRRPGTNLEPIAYGGGQERGLRAGTENVALAVALGAAAALAAEDLAAGEPDRLRGLRDRLHRRLTERLGERVVLNGPPEPRLPHTLNVSLAGVLGDALLAATPALAASTGSACHTGDPEPSPVLTAMGLDRDRGLGAVRLSVGRWTTEHDVERAAALLVHTYTAMTRAASQSTPRT